MGGRCGRSARSSDARAIPAGKVWPAISSTPRMPAVTAFTSPRAWAYALLGIDEYLRAFQGDSTVEARRDELAERLLGLFERTSRPDWPWFEDSVTYCNARLSQALIVSGIECIGQT